MRFRNSGRASGAALFQAAMMAATCRSSAASSLSVNSVEGNMALLFKREAPVLHFGPRLPKDPSTNQRMRWSERRFVLWPALIASLVCFLLNLGLLRYLYAMERR